MFSPFYTVLIIVGISIDQASKYLAEHFLSAYRPLYIIPKIFSLQLVHNAGAAYGILQGQRFFLLSVSVVVLILSWVFRHKIATTPFSKLGLSFLYIGTIGNLIDRLVNGYVIDFIDIKIFPVFNLADVSIDIAIVLFILELVVYHDHSVKP